MKRILPAILSILCVSGLFAVPTVSREETAKTWRLLARRLCRKCEAACPTGAIHAINFPPRKPAEPTEAEPKKEEVQA